MEDQFERYTVEENAGTARVTFDQGGNALVNVGFGAILAVVGFVLEGTPGIVLVVLGAGWALLAWRASSDRRVTEIGDGVAYRHRDRERVIPREEVTEVALRVSRKPRRRRKRSVLPWRVEIRSDEEKPFASYRFQEEEAARGFAAWLSDRLAVPLTDRTDASERT